MDSDSKDAAVERQGPSIREHIDDVKIHELSPEITTQALVRSDTPLHRGRDYRGEDHRWLAEVSMIWKPT